MSNTQSSSKMISLVPTNGTEFSLESGQKVIFEVPPNLGLIKGRDSYLTIDIVNTASDNRRLALEGTCGADAVISRVDIYSLRNGLHLETLQNYNQWASMTHQYLFEDKTNLQSLQGCGSSVFANFNDAGTPLPTLPASNDPRDTILSPVKTDGTQFYNFRRFTTPLKAGILRWWDSERLCPVLAFGGLRIEITLENPKVALHLIQPVASDGTKYEISTNSANGIAIPNGQAGANILSDIDFNSVEDSALAVGNLVKITSSAADLDTSITALQISGGGKLQFTLADAVPADGRTGMRLKLRTDVRSAIVRPQFRVMSVAPPQNMVNEIGGGFQYEYTTYDYLTSSLIASARQHQVEINSVATKALCLISTFTELAETELESASSYFTSATPSELNLNSVQYFLNNRLQPVRAYNPALNNEKVVAMNELVKAFSSISYEALDLGNADGDNLEQYTNSFAIARQLAKRPYHYDLKEAEGQIRLGFTGARADNVSINNFVWSKKVVVVNGNGDMEVVL